MDGRKCNNYGKHPKRNDSTFGPGESHQDSDNGDGLHGSNSSPRPLTQKEKRDGGRTAPGPMPATSGTAPDSTNGSGSSQTGLGSSQTGTELPRESVASGPGVSVSMSADPLAPPQESELDLRVASDQRSLRRSIACGWGLTQSQLGAYGKQLTAILDDAKERLDLAIAESRPDDTIRKLSRAYDRHFRTLATIVSQQQTAEMHEDRMGRLLRGESTENVNHSGSVENPGPGRFSLLITGEDVEKMPILRNRIASANGANGNGGPPNAA